MTPTPTTKTQTLGAFSVLKQLRDLIPQRPVSFAEALAVAEVQANRLTSLLGCGPEGVQEQHIAGLPRIRIVYEDLPVSGASHWNGDEWIIAIASGDNPARQRLTLLHEYKHIIDHGQRHRLYPGSRFQSPAAQAELAADYFAGCALVSKRALKWAWGSGLQRPDDLASHFGVSPAAIRVRLAQTGLDRSSDDRPSSRCSASRDRGSGRWPATTRRLNA